MKPPTVGVLALQGDFEAHTRALADVGAEPRAVRVPDDLEGLHGLVLPGGESTAITLGLERAGLAEPLRELVGSGRPVLGTCAGLILLDREHLGLLDVSARRNAFGRQLQSFETDLDIALLGGPAANGSSGEPARRLRAIFIRAPWVDDHGSQVEVLAELDGHPVAVRQGNILAVAFHPELTDDRSLHRWLLDRAEVQS